MSIATVNDLTPRSGPYTAAPAQTTFAYGFPIWQATDLKVYVDAVLKTEGLDYSVTDVGADLGGTFVFVTPLVGGEQVNVFRRTVHERTADYITNGGLSTAGINDDFDRLTLMVQEAKERLARAIVRLDTDNDTDPVMDALGARITNAVDGIDPTDLATVGQLANAVLANDSVTNAILANMATARFKGRISGGAGDPEDLTGTQATTLLDVFTDVLKGVVPASGGGTANFLRADGSWAAPTATIADGDKGHIVVSAGGTVWSIDTGVVTEAMLAFSVATQAELDVVAAVASAALPAASYTAADVLAKLLTVDGAASGLDADLLDGQSSAYYLDRANHTSTQLAATISDFAEAVDDRVGALIIDGTSIDATYNDGAGTLVLELQAAYNPVGKHAIPLPAAAWRPTTTNGCAAAATGETTTNKINFGYLAFDGTATEYAYLSFPAPKSWNESSLTAKFRGQAASASGDVIMGIQTLCLGDGDTLDSAWNAATEVTTTHPDATTLQVSAETGAIAVTGAAEGDTIYVRIYRKAADAGDTLNGVDYWLHHVDLFLTTTAAHDG